MVSRGHARGAALAASLALAFAVSAAPGMAAPVAAADQLDVRTATTYRVAPAKGVVNVVVDVTATNRAPTTTSGNVVTRYYFTALVLGLQPEAVRVRATEGGLPVTTRLTRRKGYLELEVRFSSPIYYRQSARVRVTYDLPGGRPRSTSSIRVGQAYVTFTAWVNGDAASVRILVPESFSVRVSGADLARSTSGSQLILSASGISDAARWYALVDGDRASALAEARLATRSGETIVVRAWPEDHAWLDRVSDRLERGLPVLHELIGLPWPVSGDLEVSEVHTPLLEGYSGIYNPQTNGIEISEDLDDLTIIHEASHAWFNGSLFKDRWIGEGLADTYATKTLSQIGVFVEPPVPYSRNDAAAFPLNDWPPLGRIEDKETEAREDYGYETSFRVIQSIATVAGDDAMRIVLAAAEAREIPYVGTAPAERLPDTTPDWRRLLDLLDERAHPRNAESQFRTYVVAASDLARLDARSAARTEYARLVAAGRGWLPPYAVRLPMTTWDFAAATARAGEARAVLATRDRIDQAGAGVGLTAPDALRTSYESARSNLADAANLATAELGTVRAIADAGTRLAAPRDPLTTLGLVGMDPGPELDAAKASYWANQLDQARLEATAAVGEIDAAPGRGAQLVAGAGGGIAIVVALVVALVLLRRRRSRPMVAAEATGTLPTQSSPEPGSDGDPMRTVSDSDVRPPTEPAG